jgi:hypothetical protein
MHCDHNHNITRIKHTFGKSNDISSILVSVVLDKSIKEELQPSVWWYLSEEALLPTCSARSTVSAVAIPHQPTLACVILHKWGFM